MIFLEMIYLCVLFMHWDVVPYWQHVGLIIVKSGLEYEFP